MRLSRTYLASTMVPWIKQVDIFLIVCFMLGTTTAYNLPWWSHSTEQKTDLSTEKSIVLRRVERVAETDGEIQNRDIVGNVTMNKTEHSGLFLNNTSFPVTSSLPETVDLAPGVPNSTTNAKPSASITSTHIKVNYIPPGEIVGNVSTDKSETLDGLKSVLNTNVSQDGLSQNPKDDSLKSKNSELTILAGNISSGDTKEMESDLDEELEDDDDEQPAGMFRKFLETMTINPDDMEPRETQDKITNSDILTALVFPIFMVVLVGVSLYTVHNMRSFFILRFPRMLRRYNDQDPPHPPNNDDFTDIPLDSIDIPISKEQNEDVKVEISNEKEEIDETDLLKPVRPAPQLDNIKPISKTEDKKFSRSSVRSFIEADHQEDKEDKTEEKIQHRRSSFRNFLDEIMNDQNKPEGKLDEKESQDLELEQHPTD